MKFPRQNLSLPDSLLLHLALQHNSSLEFQHSVWVLVRNINTNIHCAVSTRWSLYLKKRSFVTLIYLEAADVNKVITLVI